VLSRACSSGGDACDWLAAAVPDGGRVLDLAGGCAPLHPRLPGRECTGVDLSAAELALARRHVAGRSVVSASASALPLARHVIEPRGPFSLELGASSGFGLRDGEPGARLLRMALCVDGFTSAWASSGASATDQSRWTSAQHTTASSRVLERFTGSRRPTLPSADAADRPDALASVDLRRTFPLA
jgi:hypothetical protein